MTRRQPWTLLLLLTPSATNCFVSSIICQKHAFLKLPQLITPSIPKRHMNWPPRLPFLARPLLFTFYLATVGCTKLFLGACSTPTTNKQHTIHLVIVHVHVMRWRTIHSFICRSSCCACAHFWKRETNKHLKRFESRSRFSFRYFHCTDPMNCYCESLSSSSSSAVVDRPGKSNKQHFSFLLLLLFLVSNWPR